MNSLKISVYVKHNNYTNYDKHEAKLTIQTVFIAAFVYNINIELVKNEIKIFNHICKLKFH